ncbi:MAG TPA: hypothetical protein VG755_38845 [Nannocystaceae bacterium]|nr:hypothetical protein [Nannocystaceae bacterium]
MTRAIITLTIAFAAAALASCERSPRPTNAPQLVHTEASAMSTTSPRECELVGPPKDAPQCECIGGTARAALGDGHMTCEPGEQELARIQYGIEQGVCCEPVVPLAVMPLAPGERGRQPPAVQIADAYPGVPSQKTARRFRGDSPD